MLVSQRLLGWHRGRGRSFCRCFLVFGFLGFRCRCSSGGGGRCGRGRCHRGRSRGRSGCRRRWGGGESGSGKQGGNQGSDDLGHDEFLWQLIKPAEKNEDSYESISLTPPENFQLTQKSVKSRILFAATHQSSRPGPWPTPPSTRPASRGGSPAKWRRWRCAPAARLAGRPPPSCAAPGGSCLPVV